MSPNTILCLLSLYSSYNLYVTVQHCSFIWLQVLENKSEPYPYGPATGHILAAIWTFREAHMNTGLSEVHRTSWNNNGTLPLPALHPFHSTNPKDSLFLNSIKRAYTSSSDLISPKLWAGTQWDPGTSHRQFCLLCDMTWVCQARITVELTLPNH